MNPRMTWFLATCLGIAALSLPDNPVRGQANDAPDEARERKVMERFLGVLEKAPRRGTALDRVYGFHVERGSLDTFLKTYQDKVKADPSDGTSWLLIGLVEAQRGRDSAAVEALRKAEATRPEDALPAYYLGQALVLVGQPDAAAEGFERALAKKPSRADLLDIYQALGRVHQRAHRNDKALAVWDRLEKAFPDDPRVQEQIAHALADESQDAPALARFEALSKTTRDKFRQVQFAIEAAELKVRLGKAPEALADFENLLGKLDPESWLAREIRRKVEDVFLRTDDLAGLASYYERWIKKTPDDVEAMSRLGRTLAGQGRVAEARKWFDEAVKLAPSRRELRLALIEQLVQDRKFAEASGQYEALTKAEPNNPDVVRDWGRMLLRDTSKPEADRKKAAAQVWRKLAPDDAKDAVAVAQAADLFRQAGLSDDAIALYQKAIKLAPDASQYREYLGEYYHTLKRPEDALATWRLTVAGPARNAKTLGRLGEVLAGFGYRKEAVEPLTEACKLEPDDFDLRLKLADLALALDKPLEALPELEKAEKVASAEEQTEAVLERLIRAYQASGTLATRIEALQKTLAKTPTAASWTRLARLLEAEQKSADAARAINEATKLDPQSIPAWVATARLREAAGDLLGSAEALRTLTKLDRRSRTDYLTGIAKLEARLGRRGPALEAGRELLAAAPGNPDNHQFFAELCFQLGEPDEGLDALRRAARANPSDPKAMLTLAENLARQFRTEEAIELFWRAFAKTPEVEGKLSIVARMADQYLQRNQLDRLIGRLERELREPNQQRELSLCLAQAHSASGDYATARLELEHLLSTNARDTQLLIQLSNLAESEGDVASAAKYQKQAIEIAPSAEGTSRLAQLYLRAGEYLDAESIWTKNTEGDQDASRALSAIDQLLESGKRDAVLLITSRLLRVHPDDWELLYREAVALIGLGRMAEADVRFRAILALKVSDDDRGAFARSVGSGSKQMNPLAGRPTLAGSPTQLPMPQIAERPGAAMQVRIEAGVDGSVNQGGTFSPHDAGQSRIAVLAWMLGLAQRENKEEAFLKARREAKDQAPSDARMAWDWYYLQLVRMDGIAIFEATQALARLLPSQPDVQWAYLNSLDNRTTAPNQQRMYRQPGSTAPDPTPALASEDVDRVLASYKALQKRRPDLAPVVLSEVLAELKRANRTPEADQIYREAITSTLPGSSYEQVLTNSAAERGDVDGLLAFLNKLEQAHSTSTSNSHADTIAQIYGRSIGIRGAAKSYPQVLSILDRFLAANARAQAASQSSGRSSNGQSSFNVRNNNNGLLIWTNGVLNRGVAIDFPTSNERFDQSALGVLRTAYEFFAHDDLLSDLFNHLQARADKASGPEQVDLLLALGYCRWWNEEKDDAEQAIARAAELNGSEPLVRMILAELYEKQGSFAEALATIDRIETIDSMTVRKRETLALRLAVASGNVERSRKAAERLFGLRLDSESQVQLAALMGQLGMHDLAEAVLARARKSAGNKPTALLILMNQYQREKKTDQALQIALQILRLKPMSTQSAAQPMPQFGFNGRRRRFRQGNNEDNAVRQEAIQAISQSGKLKDLVERTEKQLERSPNSMQILQTLAEYAAVTNDREKIKSLYDRMAKSRPDDAKLRLQLGLQLLQAGDAAGAVDHYRAAIKADPSSLAMQFFQVLNAYRQADKIEEFAGLVEKMDLRAVGNVNAVMNIAQNLMVDPKVKAQGMAMFRRSWDAFPSDRLTLINLLNNNEEWWQLPEVYTYAKDVIIPAPDSSTVKAWSGVDMAQGFANDGRVISLVTRLLDAATRQNKLGELEGDVRRAIQKHPQWSGGKVLLVLVMLRDGRFDEVRSTVKELLAESKEPMPVVVRTLVGQELEDNSPVQALADELYETAMERYLTATTYDPNNDINPSPRLLSRYQAAGRLDACRDLILKLAAMKRTTPLFEPNYLEAMRLNMTAGYAQQLSGLGFSTDAVRLFREEMAIAETMASDPQASQFINKEGVVMQAQQGIQQALLSAKPEALPATVAMIFRPGPGKAKPGETLDLLLSVVQMDLEKLSVEGGLIDVIRKVARTDGSTSEVASALASLLEQAPDDFAVNIASALLAFAEGKPKAIDESMARLIRLVEKTPLEVLPPTRSRSGLPPKPNARQRTEAARQLGLWLVARASWIRSGLNGQAEILANRALEAARRQTDTRWTLAMLREWGQVALDLGDRRQAERRWSSLLDAVLDGTEPKGGKPEVIPATPRENFDRALLLAWMAADRGMNNLSTRAVREAFQGGAPVGSQLGVDASNMLLGGQQQATVVTIRTASGIARRQINPNDTNSGESATGPIYAGLIELESLWTREEIPPRQIYEILRDIVLPPGRATEVDLYPLGLALSTIKTPRSTGERLVQWAVKVGAADELREAIRSRRGNSISELSGLSLLVKLDLAQGRFEAASTTLGQIETRLQKDSLRISAELASHAAMPALQISETEKAAQPLVERVIKNLSTQPGEEPLTSLTLSLAGHYLERGMMDQGRKLLNSYLVEREKQLGQNANNPAFLAYHRRSNLLWVAASYSRRGKIADALEILGRYADIPPSQYQEASPNGTIAAFARNFAKLPADERYRLLKDWTFPVEGRKSLRSLISYYADFDPPPDAFGPWTPIPPFGGFASPLMLIEAATQAGKLDALAEEVRGLESKSVAEARTFLVLIEIARSKGADMLPKIEAMMAELKPPANPPQQEAPPAPPLGIALVARACLLDPKLGEVGDRLAEALIKRNWGGFTNQPNPPMAMMARLRRDMLRSKVARAIGQDRPIERDPGLVSWTPTHDGMAQSFMTPARSAWFEHEGQIAVSETDPNEVAKLVYEFPLGGTFEFSVEAGSNGLTEGDAGLAFGGQLHAFRSNLMIQNGMGFNNNFNPNFAAFAAQSRGFRAEGFNKITLKVEPGRVRCLVNGLLVSDDTSPDPTSPWLGLIGKGRASWRNLELVGKPEIPREVRLSHSDRLEIWSALAYSEGMAPRLPMPLSGPDLTTPEAYDWSSRDGVILGRRTEDMASMANLQSRLAYPRPILDGESVTYSFLYEPGRFEVHPSLGRLAFLLKPDGVRLHWLNDGAGLDPSGLPAENLADDPTSLRGPNPIPLKPNAWNLAKLKLQDGKLAIELNGQVIFERPILPTDDRTFGLFHFKDQTAAQVRDVVLRGDWPEKFEAARARGLTARIRPNTDPADRRADHAKVGEDMLAQDAESILDRSRTLTPPARFESLATWVLPGPAHPTFRLQGRFTPLDPAPPETEAVSTPPGRSRVQVGGELESPAKELVEAARISARLDELARMVDSAKAETPVDERGKLALLAMIRMAQGQDDPAIDAFHQLKGLAETVKPGDPDWMRWPELTAAWSALTHPKVRPSAIAALIVPTERPDDAPAGSSSLWTRQVRQARAIGLAMDQGRPFGGDANLAPWASVATPRAEERGRGFPRSSWSSVNGVWTLESGRTGEALLYRRPLRGDFEASVELSSARWRAANLAYAGLSVRLTPDRKSLEVQQGLQPATELSLTPPLEIKEDWATWKIKAQGGHVTFAIDGRVVLERSIQPDSDPWLAIEGPGRLGASARNFVLKGQPVVPDRLKLSTLPDLLGWSAEEYDHLEVNQESGWRKRGDEIVGRPVLLMGPNGVITSLGNPAGNPFMNLEGQGSPPALPNSKLESVLRYRRPLLEDSSVEYEFYFEPGKALVHPALDRLAFLIQPEGVSLHRLTDGPEDRAGLTPGNLTSEPTRRRGPSSPPLRPKAWNHIKLSLTSDVLSIELNDVPIYERPIEPTNARTFGLFHYTDESEARIRNITYQGAWPKTFPKPSEIPGN